MTDCQSKGIWMSKFVLPAVMFTGLIFSAATLQSHAQVPEKAMKRDQRSERSKSFEARFWQYLLSNNYKNWAPPAGQDGDFFEGSSVHGQLHKLYLNRTAAGYPESLPDASVIVMENYQSNKMLESISVMLRSEGSNPSQQDWYWITFGPDGSVIGSNKDNNSDGPAQQEPNSSFVTTTGAMVMGSSCTQCHQKAPGEDLVFFNSAQEKSDEVLLDVFRETETQVSR